MGIGLADSGGANFDDFMDVFSSADMIFGKNIPPELDSVPAIVDWLEMALLAWGFNKYAARFLKELAKNQGNPGLAEGLNGSWRRDQIESVVRELLGAYLSES